MSPRMPRAFSAVAARQPLFPDYKRAEMDYFAAAKYFHHARHRDRKNPRRASLGGREPYKAFSEAKDRCFANHDSNISASACWTVAEYEETRK
jgi:hypothetical protein